MHCPEKTLVQIVAGHVAEELLIRMAIFRAKRAKMEGTTVGECDFAFPLLWIGSYGEAWVGNAATGRRDEFRHGDSRVDRNCSIDIDHQRVEIEFANFGNISAQMRKLDQN